ncbi:hypothetical protein [Microvirga puerhi]|uniref:Ketopantoate reductase C-terminal domain-containing protein n=1 Tax=Microvirga puerhi TaxID=2876078 RepID=A0ABS7VVM3_9HYPH|nr:hypothetical protein [Microvirga puerhi]MBZ6079180.1 hypothetical protein [Microvirga puerhi]
MLKPTIPALCRKGGALPSRKPPFQSRAAYCSAPSIDPTEPRIITKLAQRHGLSVPLARAVAELAGLFLEMSE